MGQPSTKAEACLQEAATKYKPVSLPTHPDPQQRLHLPVWTAGQEQHSDCKGVYPGCLRGQLDFNTK